MPRKRVHELAKELGMDTRQLLARLEELGVHGKKAQSTLTEQEVALVHPETVQPETQPVVGEEKLVAERVVTEMDQGGEQVVTKLEEVRESRLSSTLIRRRATRTVLHEEEATTAETPPGEPSSAMPAVAEPFTSPPAAVPFELPVVEPVAMVPEEPEEPAVPVFPSVEAEAPVSPSSEESPVVGTQEESPLPIEEAPSGGIPVAARDTTPAPSETERSSIQAQEEAAVTPLREVQHVEAEPVAPASFDAPPPPALETPTRPRILGRIDLGKLKEASEPRPRHA